MLLDRFIYFFTNKFCHISILLMYIFNVRFTASNYEDNDKYLSKPSKHKNINEVPKKIWLYWHDTNPPEIVKRCYEKIIKLHPDYDIYFLNDSNVSKYIPEYDVFSIKSLPLRSDYIRLNLLYKFGGIWLDSSILIFEKLDFYLNLLNKNNSNFFSYYIDRYQKEEEYPISESWMLISASKTQYMKKWLRELEYAIEITPKVYIQNIRKNYPQCLGNISEDLQEYLVVYVTAQKVREYLDNYVMVNASNSAFLYNTTGSWRYIFFKNRELFHYTNMLRNLCLYHAPKKLPRLIKLIGMERIFVNKFYISGKVKKNSILDNFIKN